MAENNWSFKDLDEGMSMLEQTIKRLEDNSISIDEAINLYSEGMKLAVECRHSLNQLTHRVSEVRREAMAAVERLESEEGVVKEQLDAKLNAESGTGGVMNGAKAANDNAPNAASGHYQQDLSLMQQEQYNQQYNQRPEQISPANGGRTSGSNDDIPF